tara:strand:+ start:60 stop:206 length:147 start_codon:yes stop_codon:yes gene_type:complete
LIRVFHKNIQKFNYIKLNVRTIEFVAKEFEYDNNEIKIKAPLMGPLFI